MMQPLGSEEDQKLEDGGVQFLDEPPSLWDPLPYFVLLHHLIDGGLGDLRSGDQLLYLKMFRESCGRGRDTVAITMTELGRTTGLGKRAVEEGLRRLAHDGMIRVLAKGHGHIATEYHIVRAVAPAPPEKQSFKPSIETLLSQLSSDEHSKLLHMARTLEPDDRARIESEITEQFHALGLLPSPPMRHQAFLYKVLSEKMFHTIKESHPSLFS